MPKEQLQITHFFHRQARESRETPLTRQSSQFTLLPDSPRPRKYNPQSPCPELLDTNSPPTEAQLSEIRRLIAAVAVEIPRTDDEIVRLQLALPALRRQRAQAELAVATSLDAPIMHLQSSLRAWRLQSQRLLGFMSSHQNVLSPLRRLPNELLAEIFLYSEPRDALDWQAGDPTRRVIRLALVCRRWHDVILSLPRLWRTIRWTDGWDGRWNADDAPGRLEGTVLAHQRLESQLKAIRHRSLAIQWDLHHDGWICDRKFFIERLVASFLELAPRLEELSIVFTASELERLEEKRAAQGVEFPRLRRLRLQVHHQSHDAFSRVRSFVNSFPGLEELFIGAAGYASFYTSAAPWAQLQKVTFKGCFVEDVVPILSLLPAGSSLVLWDIDDDMIDEVLAPDERITIQIASLELKECTAMLLNRLTGSLIAPQLHTLLHADNSIPTITSKFIFNLLTASGCFITHLRLGVDEDSETASQTLKHLRVLFQCECVRTLTTFELACATMVPDILYALTVWTGRKLALPYLRVLGLFFPREGVSVDAIRKLKDARPELHTLRLVTCRCCVPRSHYDLGRHALSALQKKGLRILVTDSWD